MQVRRSLVPLLVVGGAVAVATPDALAGNRQVSTMVQTHPQVRPTVGRRYTTFELTFTLSAAPGRAGTIDTYYREVVSPATHAPGLCSPRQPAPVFSGQQGGLTNVALKAPARGWCKGHYLVTVFLQRMGPCGPPVEPAAAAIVCPEIEPGFPINEVNTGEAHFSVH